MKNRTIASLVAIAALAACQAANAAALSAVVGGHASAGPWVSYENFDGTTLSLDIDFTTDAALVSGALGGFYAAPWVSGVNNNYFGSANPTDSVGFADKTSYLTTGSSGAYADAKIIVDFHAPQNYLGLLWGSIDNYNNITFKDEDGKVIDSVNGIQAYNAISRPPDSYLGDQTQYGTAYVNIWTAKHFWSVEFTSTQYAFEFDNMAHGLPDAGASISLLGLAFMGLGIYGRKFGVKA